MKINIENKDKLQKQIETAELEKMKLTIQQKIENTGNLEELLELLNGWSEIAGQDFEDRLENQVDLCSLPTFGSEPDDTMEVFSWDDHNVLIQNTCVGPAFKIVSRIEFFES